MAAVYVLSFICDGRFGTIGKEHKMHPEALLRYGVLLVLISLLAMSASVEGFAHYSTLPPSCTALAAAPTARMEAGALPASVALNDIAVNVGIGTYEGDSKKWAAVAAETLATHGVCALRPSGDGSALISPASCDAVDGAIHHHLASLHNKIRNRGIDPMGVEDGPYRFREVVCRDGSPRFDVPVPWSGYENEDESNNECTLGDFIDDSDACQIIQDFQKELDEAVQPVADALWSRGRGDATSDDEAAVMGGRATSAGFLVNQPGSTSQQWHRDGPDPGYINAFVPLVDLSESLGPTSVLPGTHVMPNIRTHDDANEKGSAQVPAPIVPLLTKGQVLLFDYRTLHKGLGNTNAKGLTRTLAYAVYTRGSIMDTHNFPDALTLEYD